MRARQQQERRSMNTRDSVSNNNGNRLRRCADGGEYDDICRDDSCVTRAQKQTIEGGNRQCQAEQRTEQLSAVLLAARSWQQSH